MQKMIDASGAELAGLLKKMIILELFKLAVPQTVIAKRLRLDIRVVNDFLKGVRRPSGMGA